VKAGLRDPRVRQLAPRVAVLQIAAALTEGVGLVLLVPLLAGLAGPGSAVAGPLAGAIADLGLGRNLPALLALFVVLVAARAALVMARNRAALTLELALVDGLRQRAWRALLGADWRLLQGLRRSDQASLLITNLDRVGQGVNQLLLATTTVVTLLALGLAALAIYPLFALAGGLAGLLVLLAYRGLRGQAARLGEALGAIWDRVHSAIGEALGALRSIKILGREAEAEAMVMTGFAELGAARQAYHTGQALGQFLLQTGGAAALALLVWLALAQGQLSAVTVLPLIAVFARALPLIGILQEAWQQWRHAAPALVAAEAQIAAMRAAAEAPLTPAAAPGLAREARFNRVTLHYAGQAEPALVEVSLAIPARQITALVGPSGAGKSTVADLLAGLLGPDGGAVTIDGTMLEGAAQRAWRAQVAYIDQDPLLLAASLRDNLYWAAPAANDAQVWAALEDAAAADFVRGLPEGLNTRLGDGGRRLSGGERQRLMLARALLRDPQLLILDEATSALDADNEAAIAAALGRLRGRMTIVLIAHRGALLDLADQVIRLESGRVVDES
jgi:ATP-binding cassette subfamily C protein